VEDEDEALEIAYGVLNRAHKLRRDPNPENEEIAQRLSDKALGVILDLEK
jgi:hypothetical protein